MPRFTVEKPLEFEIDHDGVIETVWFRGQEIQIMDVQSIFRTDIDECLATSPTKAEDDTAWTAEQRRAE